MMLDHTTERAGFSGRAAPESKSPLSGPELPFCSRASMSVCDHVIAVAEWPYRWRSAVPHFGPWPTIRTVRFRGTAIRPRVTGRGGLRTLEAFSR